MQQPAPDIFKVEDENGMVALYKRVQHSQLAVGVGEVLVPAKLLGYTKADQACDIPWFKDIAATLTPAESEEAA